jgi:hypothetical protein
MPLSLVCPLDAQVGLSQTKHVATPSERHGGMMDLYSAVCCQQMTGYETPTP